MKIKTKKQGFTMIEVIVSSAIFIIGMTIVSQVYLAIVRSVILAQTLQANIDSARYGLQKIWNEIKESRNFTTSTTYNNSVLEFKDRRCRNVVIKKESNKLIIDVNGATSSIFDEKLINVNNFQYFFDTLTDPNSTNYKIYSRKLVNVELDLDLKINENLIPFKIRTSVAPLKSVITEAPPCP